jgi:hypothetical protein
VRVRVIRIRGDRRVLRNRLANIGDLLDLLRVVGLAFLEGFNQFVQLVFVQADYFVLLFEELLVMITDNHILLLDDLVFLFQQLFDFVVGLFILFCTFARLEVIFFL